MKEDGHYGCPKNFNQLTPSWYLNHSDHPNVAFDSNDEFFALRDIRANEELTVDYSTYSESSRPWLTASPAGRSRESEVAPHSLRRTK